MERKTNVSYGAIQFEYWMIQGVLFSFASAFLLNAGFENKMVGVITCLGNLLSVPFQLGLASFADKNPQIELTFIMKVVKCTILICVIPLIFLYKSSSVWTLLIFTFALAGHLSFLPLINELNYRIEVLGIQMNFGLCRSMGSLGYSVLCFLLGYLTDWYGTIMIPVSAGVILVICLVTLHILEKIIRKLPREKTERKKAAHKGGMLDYIKRNKRIFIVNIGAAMLLYSSQMLGIYMLQILLPLGGTNADVGMANAIQAIFEMPAMALFVVVTRKFSRSQILKFSSIGFVIKAFLILLAKSVPVIFLAQMTQFFGYAMFFPAMVGYLHDMCSEDEAALGQAMFTMMTSVSGVAATLSGGMIIDYFGISAVLTICLFSTVVGSVFVNTFVKKEHANQQVYI